MSDPTVLINIVLFNPDKNKTLELIRVCLYYKFAKILLFDNARSWLCMESINTEQIVLFQSPKNVGVAGAHHYACKMAERENFNFVLFLDQDTQLPENFINDMVIGFYQLKKYYPCLSAIGPSWQDPRIDNYGENNLKKKLFSQKKEKILNLLGVNNTIISSGMLILVSALNKIGYPKKEYFIDLVDIEWCLRARSKNFQIKKLNHIQIQHDLGEVKITKNKILNYQKPMRYYYSIRNSLVLFREKQFPFRFRLYILIKNLKEMQKIPFVPESRESLFAALSGIKDGILLRKDSLYK
ncbi:MAG: glycosyltransferase [Candidatus Aquirickettsiella sp.]